MLSVSASRYHFKVKFSCISVVSAVYMQAHLPAQKTECPEVNAHISAHVRGEQKSKILHFSSLMPHVQNPSLDCFMQSELCELQEIHS